jgi:hypothetical protein
MPVTFTLQDTSTDLDERYPEHAKQELVKEPSQAIGRFLDWARSKDYEFGRTTVERVAVFEGTEDVTALRPIEGQQLKALLAQHFGIDLAEIAAEKEQMVADMAALNTPAPDQR